MPRFDFNRRNKPSTAASTAHYKDGGLIFSQPDRDYLCPHLVWQTIVRRMQMAGIKDASLHTLRHTLASILLSNGIPLPAVSARLGHADVNITARIYSHLQPDDDVSAADTYELAINAKPSEEAAPPQIEKAREPERVQ